MLPDLVSNPGPLTYESGALPTALTGPVRSQDNVLTRFFYCRIEKGQNFAIQSPTDKKKYAFLAWTWLAKPKANVVIPKNQPLPK